MVDNHSDLLDPQRYRGYAQMEGNQRVYIDLAISKHEDWAELWYRLFNAYSHLMDKWEHISKFPFPDHPEAHQLALHMALSTGGFAKIAFDCAMSGFYAQSFSMVRHLFEIWQRLEYVALMPETAKYWFRAKDGSDPRPPGEGTIQRALLKSNVPGVKGTATIVERNMKYIDKFSHPSEYLFQQTIGDEPGQFKIGGNYRPTLCLTSNHDGTAAFMMVLTSLVQFSTCSTWFAEELMTIRQLGEQARNRSAGVIDEYRASFDGKGHWILGEPRPL